MKNIFKIIIIAAVTVVSAFSMCGCSGDKTNDVKQNAFSSENRDTKIKSEGTKGDKSDSSVQTKKENKYKNGEQSPQKSSALDEEKDSDVNPSGNKNTYASENDENLFSDNSQKSADEYKLCITSDFEGFGGEYSYAFCDYTSGIRICENSVKMKSASIIKLFIMEYAYSLVGNNKITLKTTVGGQSLLTLIESMIIYSDNNATNVLIEHFTMDKINEFIKQSGYNDTQLKRKMLDTAAIARGDENYTSSGDVLKFLDNLYQNRDSFPQKDMLDIMKRQSVSTKIRRDIPAGVEIANKTGELSDTDNDAGIIFTQKGDFAFVCLTSGASPEPARTAIAKSAKNLYDYILNKE